MVLHGRAVAFQSVLADGNNFSRLHIAHKFRAQHVERAGFGGDHVGFAQFADAQRANAPRVAHAVYMGTRHQHQGVRPVYAGHHFLDAFRHGFPAGARNQMRDHLRIHIGLKQYAVFTQIAADGRGVYQVSVMRQR